MNYHGFHGFDVSTYQDSPLVAGHIDFQKMREWGADFVIIRAGQGNWEDVDFKTSWANAKGVLPRATYFYYDNRYPPKDQARKYFDIIKHDLDGMCWLDLEDKQAGLYAGWQCWYDFIEELKRIYPGVRVGIYTGFYYFLEYTAYAQRAQRDYFGRYPLWLAWYLTDPLHPDYSRVMTPLPWLEYDILQTGTPAIGHAVGVESDDIDYNQFSGDEVKFRQFFNAIYPEPIEEPMRYTATSIYPMSLRPDHNTSNTPIRTIAAQSRMQGDILWEAVGEKWLKVTHVNDVALPVSGWVAIVSASRVYCTLTDNQPPQPVTFPAEMGVTIGGVTKTYVLKP